MLACLLAINFVCVLLLTGKTADEGHAALNVGFSRYCQCGSAVSQLAVMQREARLPQRESSSNQPQQVTLLLQTGRALICVRQ